MQAQTDNTGAPRRLSELAAVRRPDDPIIGEFLRLYYNELPEDDVEERKLDDIYAVGAAHLDLGRVRLPGSALVRAVSPEPERDGWRSAHSVVLMVTDDMPFLVDTMRLVLDNRGLDIHLLVHPMLVVERDDDGTLLRVAPLDPESPPTDGQIIEAWTQLEIDRVDDAGAVEIEGLLIAAVDDVRRMVGGFVAMRDRLRAHLDAHPALAWLADGHLVFLGAVDAESDDTGHVTPLPETALGLLDGADDDALASVSFPTTDGVREDRPAVVTRADAISTVFRPQRETVLIVTDPAAPEVQHRFVGLLSTAAQRASVLDIPGFGAEIARQLELVGDAVHSHSGRAARTVIENLPRDLVLEMSPTQVADLVREIVGLQERRIVRVFEVPEPVGLWTTVLVYFPRSRFSADLPEVIGDIVADAYGAEQRTFETFVGSSTLARVTVSVRRPTAGATADLDELADTIDERSTSWHDRLSRALVGELGERAGHRLFERLGKSTSASYRAAVAPDRAVADLSRVEEVLGGDSDFATSIGHDVDARPEDWRMRVYRRGTPMVLSDLLPLLGHLGFVALDEQPFTFRVDQDRVYLYDIGVRVPTGCALDEATRADVREAFTGLVAGTIESDGFNRLVLLARLTAREVAIVRAYAKYLRQIGFAFSQGYIEDTLARYAGLARQLVALFHARFDPDLDVSESDRTAAQESVRTEIGAALDKIPSLDDDRICRSFLMLIDATVRTNYYRDRPTVAFKLDPSAVTDLPLPRPAHEIWVCGPRVEGVHLRGGPIARGGLRWSDRREDFRTEVLGLMKAQMVKNAVIVPTGAKGGFVVKRPNPDPEANRQEVVQCYQNFIRGLLDLTDNLVDGEPVPPPRTVAHDPHDSYLVVAADKGTATFSDIANAVSAEYGFWLGDAFASGGSVGYDHKVMGITARGAWESVRRHARVLGRNADTDPLTAVGVGDMSGDVFGNGMLRSRLLRLVAAFDHRHVFVDPTPDPEASYAERERLFALPRSSWADYDPELISAGGGVYPRTLKSISLSPEARSVLGISDGPLTPDALVSAVLRAPVDLLWNGGIGTYVKATTETTTDVGDRANDGLRVNGSELRCRMVGEGGNLGFTQLGRVEYALGGGLIYTDAIDNSAGVDCSDHEVNIKILLDGLVRAGEMTGKQRNELLGSMTDEVGRLVLQHNQAQTLALVMARRQSQSMANVHARYIEVLESEGWLDRSLEFLPTDKQMAERQLSGTGLTAPEFAVLIAYTKNTNVAEMVKTDLPDAPLLAGDLLDYFPSVLRERFVDAIAAHPLRREIIATRVVNQMVNLSGISFDHRVSEDTGASVVDVTRAWLVSRDVFGFQALWDEIDGLDEDVSLDTQLGLFLDARRMVERGTLWVLRHRRPPFDLTKTVARYQPGIGQLAGATLNAMLRGRMADMVASGEASRLAAGVPEGLAERAGVWPLLHTAFDAVDLAENMGRTVLEVSAVQWRLFDVLDMMWLWEGIGTLPRSTRWQTQARSGLRDELLTTLADLTIACMAGGAEVDEWLAVNARAINRVGTMLTDIRRVEAFDLTTLSVGLRQLQNLALTSVSPTPASVGSS